LLTSVASERTQTCRGKPRNPRQGLTRLHHLSDMLEGYYGEKRARFSRNRDAGLGTRSSDQ
jgi:hypothetical protein